MLFKKMALASASGMLFAFAAHAAEAPAAGPIPVSAFFARSQFSGALLSPDGANVALMLRGPDGNTILAIKPTAGGAARPLASIRDMDIGDVHWVNNRRVVYSAVRLDDGDERKVAVGPGLHAINIDGSKPVHLIAHDWSGNGRGTTLPPNTRFLSAVHDDTSSDVFVVRYEAFKEDLEGYSLFRLNTETRNLVRVDAPENAFGVLIDAGGVPRVAHTRENGAVIIHYNDPKTGKWRKLDQFPMVGDDGFVPILVTRSGQLYVLANQGRDTQGLYRYDVDTRKMDPDSVVGLKNYDFNGSLVLAPDRESVLGLRYETSEPITTWLDDGMRQVQDKVDALLPATINRVEPARDAASDAMLVGSYSDTEPGFWHLYHRSTGKLTRLGTSLPGISPLAMSAKSMVRYKAGDGLDIPAYLTLPKGGNGKDLPMVVLVHGGPWARGGHMMWNREVQFLASRGYAVLQPEFRGSTGFGRAHFKASWKQWGQAMQEDVADGARWAIAQGIADPKRICIAGASYGGYATLMGLVKHPDLFRCGVDWVGVTDINLLYDLRFTNTSQDAKKYGLPTLIGDQDKDAAMLKANSPLENAGAIKQPLLLAYGAKDRTVPIAHGKKFYDAVKKTNPRVEWIEYPEEGHGWYYERDQVDFWTRVEKFLGENIGKN
jgi:dipeptidyl aminopeptidase/acylaminoacyl peptidase